MCVLVTAERAAEAATTEQQTAAKNQHLSAIVGFALVSAFFPGLCV